MRRTDGGRRDAIPLNTTPDRGQLPEYLSELASVVECKEAWRVLQERDVASQRAKGVERLGPEPTLISTALPLAGDGGGLAGDARSEYWEVVGDSGESAGKASPSDAGEEVDLSIASELERVDVADVAVIDATRREPPFLDALEEHLGGVRVDFVVVRGARHEATSVTQLGVWSISRTTVACSHSTDRQVRQA